MSDGFSPYPRVVKSQRAIQVASTLGVVGLVAGVPALLVALHADPPLRQIGSVLVNPNQVKRLVATRVTDDATVKLVWSIAWLAWLWFIVCLSLEMVGRFRGRTRAKMPGSRYVHSLVTGLLGASLAFGSPTRLSPIKLQVAGASAPSPVYWRQTESVPTDGGLRMANVPSGGPLDSPTGVPEAASTLLQHVYVVRPRDTLWSIAGAELGSPLDWRAIAAANYGRPQPDGEALTDDHWIRPGWVFVLPASGSAPSATSHAPPTPLAIPTTHETRAPTDAVVPAVPFSPTLVLGRTELPRASTIAASRSSGNDTPIHPPTKTEAPPSPRLPVAPIGYGLLGAGIVALIDRMRRAQSRHRSTGLRIALPEGDLVELERGLRMASDQGSADWIDLSLRLLSVTVRQHGLETPAVVAVRLRDDAVEIILDAALPTSPAPPPFESGPDGTRWILTKSGSRIEALRNDPKVVGVDAPLPSLVTLGRDELGVFMVNIEKAGSVAVSGEDTLRLVQAIAVELATAKWADQIDLVLVGFGDISEGLERVSHARSLHSVGARMERRVRERAALLTLVDRATNDETRWSEGGDAWDLSVVVCSPDASVDERVALEDLLEVAGDGSFGVVVICGCDVASARWRVRADGGTVSVEDGGLRWPSLHNQSVPSNFIEGIADLVSVAAQRDGVSSEEAPYASLALRIPERESTSDADSVRSVAPGDETGSQAADATQTSVEVRVLGPVEILGAARQFTRAWAIELVVYLAVHPGGASNDQWATALWPDKEMAPASLHSTASAARRSLGTSTSEEDHLPRSRGRLVLGPGVRTDWDTFVDRARSPRPEEWREALQLIRGRPFDGLRSPDWVVLEGILATVEAVVVDLACKFAQHCLDNGDAPSAEWAARQGLRVSPYDERLYRVLLKSSDAAGNPAGVESIMAELIHLIADDVEPFDAVHPETLSLYRNLSRRSFAARSR